MGTHDNGAGFLGAIGLICFIYGGTIDLCSFSNWLGILQGAPQNMRAYTLTLTGIVLTVIAVVLISVSTRLINRMDAKHEIAA